MWSLCILELLLIFHQLSWLQILALTSLSNQIFILLILIAPVSQGQDIIQFNAPLAS